MRSAPVDLSPERPRLLMEPVDVTRVRERAEAVPGVLDRVAEQAREAAVDERYFNPPSSDTWLYPHLRGVLKPLWTAAFLLDDEPAARRALEAVEMYFERPTREWAPLARRYMRCHHAIPNTSAVVGLALDYLGDRWGGDAVASITERITDDLVPRFLETWRKKDEHWTGPEYHFNMKLMCCAESGLGALAFREQVSDLQEVLMAALDGTLDVLDHAPPEGDWQEGPSYWLNSLCYALRFGIALRRATGGFVELLSHPVFHRTGDFLMHVTEPDGGFYDFNDGPVFLPDETVWDYMSLLAANARRGDWARAARISDRWTLERLRWDDPFLESSTPQGGETAMGFPMTGVVTMRSGWEEADTFVGFKSGPSDVGHSHLDANSFVLSAGGERLLVDEGSWPYAGLLGFFDESGPRFDFDANGTAGHNTLLVDGQGQLYGPEHGGKIVDFRSEAEADIVSGDATTAYGGSLDRYIRTLAFVKPDLVLVLDQVRADRPRYLEWLFHHRGEAVGDERGTTITRGEAVVSLVRILPDVDDDPWRISDVERTSIYTGSNSLETERVKVRYRSFGPLHPVERIDVLWAISVGNPGDRPGIEASVEDESLKVTVDTGSESRTMVLDRIP